MNQPRRTFPEQPQTPNALLLTAHPLTGSFNHALANAWTEGAETVGIPVTHIDISSLEFDLRLNVGHKGDQPLEPDLQKVKTAIANAAHIVVAFPLWWGSTPAQLKGLFDRVLLPGWAFTYKDNGLPLGGLAGRSGRVIVTMGAPTWFDTLVYRRSARRQVERATLKFCGLKPVNTSAFGSVEKITEKQSSKMLAQIRRAGEADAANVLRRFSAPFPVDQAI